MDREQGGNLLLWLPGSALLASLIAAGIFTATPHFRPERPQPQPALASVSDSGQQIDARLWEDPFGALAAASPAARAVAAQGAPSDGGPTLPPGFVAELARSAGPAEPECAPVLEMLTFMLPDGSGAEAVEQRRRARYAMVAGLNRAGFLPYDELHIGRFDEAAGPTDAAVGRKHPIAYEFFRPNPWGKRCAKHWAVVLWSAEQDYAGVMPLQRLRERLDRLYAAWVATQPTEAAAAAASARRDTAGTGPPFQARYKLIGPASSGTLAAIYREADGGAARAGGACAAAAACGGIEVYSPVASAEEALLHPPGEADAIAAAPEPPAQVLRIAADDRMLAAALLRELARRGVDPARGHRCDGAVRQDVAGAASRCNPRQRRRGDRIAIVSELDSTYARYITRSFKREAACIADNPAGCTVERPADSPLAASEAFDWVLRFSYLRGLDGAGGRSKNEAADKEKAGDDANARSLRPPERADGDSQLDYLRRLATQIAEADAELRRNGGSGIGAIGVLGNDAYDKLLVLQALRQRMPGKLYFSTDLDARLLHAEQTEWTRNLILAAPFGLRAQPPWQLDTPPFRDSGQTAIFIALQLALAPQHFDVKRSAFARLRRNAGLLTPDGLTPSLYEVGLSGFVGLPDCTRRAAQPGEPIRCSYTRAAGKPVPQMPDPLLEGRGFQLPTPALYPSFDRGLGAALSRAFARWHSAELIGVLVLLGSVLWASLLLEWPTKSPRRDTVAAPGGDPSLLKRFERLWVLPYGAFVLAVAAALAGLALSTTALLWAALALTLLGIWLAQRLRVMRALGRGTYVVLPALIYLLTLWWAYGNRDAWTDWGAGEPMALTSGISVWPTLALRYAATLMSIAAIFWGWRRLRDNAKAFARDYGLLPGRIAPLRRWYILLFVRACEQRLATRVRCFAWLALVRLRHALLPLSEVDLRRQPEDAQSGPVLRRGMSGRDCARALLAHTWVIDRTGCLDARRFWREHELAGSGFARALRVGLLSWIYICVLSLAFARWPVPGAPIRGEFVAELYQPVVMLSVWAYTFLVFWVVDANWLLSRMIDILAAHPSHWPAPCRNAFHRRFGVRDAQALDDLIDIELIAERTATVGKLVYAPAVVLVLFIFAANRLFDDWVGAPSLLLSYVLGGLLTLFAAYHLRTAAERARRGALAKLEQRLICLRADPSQAPTQAQLELLREHLSKLRRGAFGRFSEEPALRALLVSASGFGGSWLLDVLNLAAL